MQSGIAALHSSPERTSSRRSSRALASCAVAALAALTLASLAGCSQENSPTAAPASSSTTASEPASTAAASEQELTPAETPPAPPSTSGRSTQAPSADPQASRATSSTPSRSAAPTPGLPRMVEAQQGGSYWAVLVAYSPEGEDQAIIESLHTVHALGYPMGTAANLSCLPGVESLVPDYNPVENVDARAVAPLFATQADANRFAQLVGDVDRKSVV